MTDRELLEAAAKAAGVETGADDFVDPIGRKYCQGLGLWVLAIAGRPELDGRWWNPLGCDGDALRLAVKLRMCVDSWGSGAAAVVTINNRALVAEAHYGDDPERATRRAIVRAAAAMGEKA